MILQRESRSADKHLPYDASMYHENEKKLECINHSFKSASFLLFMLQGKGVVYHSYFRTRS